MAYTVPFEVHGLTFAESISALQEIVRVGISPMLETVEDMLAELGDPDLCFESVQIAGTNGKTSTSRYTQAILMGEGYRCALYTSPELVSYTERMEIDGIPVSEEAFAHGLSCALEAGRRVNAKRTGAGELPYDLTEFDLLTVGALVVFAEAGVDIAVLECGMGGRWDATSAAKSIRGVTVTGVGLDHMRILGDTIEAIAGEKAATIKNGRFCVLGAGTATPVSAERVFLERAEEQGVTPVLLRPDRIEDYPTPPLGEVVEHPELPHAGYRIVSEPHGLDGSLVVEVTTTRAVYSGLSCVKPAYQAANIANAVAFCEELIVRREGLTLDTEALIRSVAACPTPGRFDAIRISPLALVDAAHNPQSVEAFLDAIRGFEPDASKRPLLLCAVLADKDVPGIVELLADEFEQVVCTRTSSSRALPASALAELFRDAGRTPIDVFETVGEALEALEDTPFIACGSITLAGEVAGIMRGQEVHHR